MPEYDGKVHIFTGLYWGFFVSYIGSYSTFLAGTAWFLIVTYYTQPTWQTIINSIVYTFYERIIASSIEKIIDELASTGVPDFITGAILFMITTVKSIWVPSSKTPRSFDHASLKRNRSPRVQIINDNDLSIDHQGETSPRERVRLASTNDAPRDIPTRDPTCTSIDRRSMVPGDPPLHGGLSPREAGAPTPRDHPAPPQRVVLEGTERDVPVPDDVICETIYQETLSVVSQQLLTSPKEIVATLGAPTPRSPFFYEGDSVASDRSLECRPIVPPKIRIRGTT
jgi:hypothetical protein